jgi:GDP-4-dehydro-6-deoxy-D-mannose reductase
VKRVLITGASGFAGRHLSKYLKGLGSYQVYAGHRKKVFKTTDAIPVFLDLDKPKQVSALLNKIKPHFICHLAAQSNARLSWKKVKQTWKTNFLGTLNLAREVLRVSPNTKILYTSSVHSYGRTMNSRKPVKENSPLWPENPYAVTKALSEMALLNLYKKQKLNLVIVRVNNLFGTEQNPDFIFSNWCSQIASIERHAQRPEIKVGDLNLKRDFLDVRDAVKAYELLLRKGKMGEIYNLASGRKLKKLKDHLETLLSMSEAKIKIKIDPARIRKNEPKKVNISAQKLRSLGWRPAFAMRESLEHVLQSYRTRND